MAELGIGIDAGDEIGSGIGVGIEEDDDDVELRLEAEVSGGVKNSSAP